VSATELLGSVGGLDDLLPGFDESLGQHAQVEAGPVMGHQQRRHPRVVHADPDAEAGHPGLGDLELGRTDTEAVTDADLVVGETRDGEVLAELPEREVVAPQLVLPVAIGVDLVDEHGTVLAAVRHAVTLVVPVDVDVPHHPRPGDRLLPDRGTDGPALPGHLARPADVDRQQPPRHRRRLVAQGIHQPVSDVTTSAS
jgi:hypothetical protein